MATTPTYNARQLRVVSNVTQDWYGGYTVELGDSGYILAGPYATKQDAQQAKRDLVAGHPVRSAG
jgi:hypothetical protein